MEIRQVQTAAELQQLAALEQAMFTDAWSRTAITESAARDEAFLFGAFREQQLIGYCIVYFAADEGEIMRIAVDAAHRRQGIGSRLLLFLEDHCENRGIAKLFLEVRESNALAIDFYTDNGFVNSGLRKGFYQNPPEDAVLMNRDLKD